MFSNTTVRTALQTLVLFLLTLVASRATAQVPVYTQAPDGAGGQYKSSWYAPDGLDSDEYVWDAFTLSSNTAITQVRWRGTYAYANSGVGRANVYDFTVAIYGSIAANSQPDVVSGPLVRYHTNGNAGETGAGSAGGLPMYDYQFTLPSAFQAGAGVKYWVQIEAYQGVIPNYYWPPDWSIARGTGGDGSHFRKIGGTGGNYAFISGDCAFTLYASGAPSFNIAATVQPVGAGAVSGAGVYPSGSSATLTANPNPGFNFLRWTENGSQVSTNRAYTFTVTRDRSLVANFVPAYTITTSNWPSYAGTTTGGGTYSQGATVTVTATPRQGFVFTEWLDYGTPVSSSATYAFPADADHALTAVYGHDANSTSFDFDAAPVHTSLPLALSSDGLTVWLSGTGSGYSVQFTDAMGFTPAGFAGLCLYPNSVFAADLVADFSTPLTFFSIMYSPQELGCDSSARMRVTAYRNGVQVGTATATAPVPGTWPTGTLAISVPGGFDRAVVHYDARPPTCQDYGPIFLADNMTVTMACVPVVVTSDPAPVVACAGSAASFDARAAGTPPISYQWYKDGAPIDPASNPSAAADQLVLLDVKAGDAGAYHCVTSNACGTAATAGATLDILPAWDIACGGAGCDPDFNADGNADQDDVAYLINIIGGGDNPSARDPDFTRDGNADQDDVSALINTIGGGGCP